MKFLKNVFIAILLVIPFVYLAHISKQELPTCIALITIYIAYQQYVINKNKLKLDLYEKRYSKFIVLQGFMKDIASQNFNQIDYSNIKVILADVEFLFEVDITNYKDLIISKYWNLLDIISEMDTSSHLHASSELSANKADILKWFREEDSKLKELFKPYLDFTKTL